MTPRVLAVLVLAALAGAGTAHAGEGWKRVTITRHKGAISATLAYDTRQAGTYKLTEYRRLVLTVRRAGKVMLVDRKVCGGIRCDPNHGRIGGEYDLSLEDMWGSKEPEARIDMFTGYAHCCVQVEVALIGKDGPGRVLFHDFGNYGYLGQRHGRRYYFVGNDNRFAYAFASFAASGAPTQALAIDPAGRRFVDVTRSRPRLVEADAADLWQGYLGARARPGEDVLGTLSAWCADQYLLGGKSRCDTALAAALSQGYLRKDKSLVTSFWPDGKGFIALLHKKLAAWGYDRA